MIHHRLVPMASVNGSTLRNITKIIEFTVHNWAAGVAYVITVVNVLYELLE